MAAAGLAVREVAGDPALVAQTGGADAALVDDALHAQAALAADELLVLLAEALAGAEERALDRGAGHVEALADLAIGEPLELAHHEDVVVHRRQAAERAAQAVERELALDGGVRRRARLGEAVVLGGADLVGRVERHLVRVAPAAVGVDALVLGDLVDPGPEEDLALVVGRAGAAAPT